MNAETKNIEAENANINVIFCESYQQMLERLAEAQMASQITTIPGTLYRQGTRWCLQTALDLQALTVITSARRVAQKTSDVITIDSVRASTNRPLDKQHASTIGKYIADAVKSKSHYILPSLTLNFDQKVDVLAIKSNSRTLSAFMIMPVGIRMEITDGQHRIEGVKRAIEMAGEVGQDGIGAMITFTSETAQVHQDFADCAKTKSIPPSMLAVFDMRNPANSLALDLVERHPLFKYTVDAAKKSVSARSTAAWTTNQIRVMLKWGLIGAQASDEVFANNAHRMLDTRGSERYNSFLDGICKAFDIMSEYNETLRKLVAVTPETMDRIAKIRESDNSMLMTGSGLAVVGYLWNTLRDAQGNNPMLDTERAMKRIALLDWSASSPLFAKNLKINPERTQSGQKYVRDAGNLIWSEIQRQEGIAA